MSCAKNGKLENFAVFNFVVNDPCHMCTNNKIDRMVLLLCVFLLYNIKFGHGILCSWPGLMYIVHVSWQCVEWSYFMYKINVYAVDGLACNSPRAMEIYWSV